jgi:predicted TIM-barrel fold metal-dependent hydrolase
MAVEKIISADSHFVEPPEIWADRIDHEFKDRAPHLEKDPPGHTGLFLVCEDLSPTGGSAYFAAGVPPEELAAVMATGYEAAPAHVRDPAARLDAQDRDGVSAEVLYSSYGMQLFHLADGRLRAACFRAFNDWAAEYCSHDRTRLCGIGLIDLDDVESGVAEVERIAGLGLKGAMIWAEPPGDRPYSHPDYERFWAAAQDLDMKLSLHSLTSRRPDSDPGSGDILYRSVVLYQEVGRTLADLVLHGVLERFPTLKFISAENEIAWLPFHLWRMDQLAEKLRPLTATHLPLAPSEYFNRQFFATFIEDPLLSSTLSSIGAGNIMWSSDFPHLASSWPNSHAFVDKTLSGASARQRRLIAHDTVAGLYGIG